MKKPAPKNTPQKRDATSIISNQMLGKILDIGKELASTRNNLVDLDKEKERTRQVVAEAHGKVAKAQEKTKQVEKDVNARITDIHRAHHQDVMEHELAMAKLQGEREDARARNSERERLLNKLLEEPSNEEQVAQQYRALIDADKPRP